MLARNAARKSSALLILAAACSPDPYPQETGKILHASLRLLPKSFDPPMIEEEGSGKIASHVYDGLLMYHPFARPYKLLPALAESMPEISADKKTYTFKLKPGIRFVDDACFRDGKGREVTAEDFHWCYKRFAHPETKAKGWWLFRGKVVGLDAWRAELEKDIAGKRRAGEDVAKLWGIERPVLAEKDGRTVAGFEVLDRYTFRFRLTKPYPQFLWILAMPYASVYPHEAVEYYGEEFRNNPVGTGPFRVKEFNPVYRVVYERNTTYREHRFPDPRNKAEDRIPGWHWERDEAAGRLKNAGKRIPLLDGIETRFILEDQPRWLYFKAGFTDFLNPPKDNTDEALPGGELSPEMKARGVRLDPWPELGTVYTCLNCDDPILANVKLRRAMALAFDHKWTADNLYSGQAIVATSLIPPGVAGFDPDYHPYHRKDGRAQVEKAKQMLAEAGYPGGIDPRTGKPLRLTYENSGTSATSMQFGERFKHEMREIGIQIDEIVNTFPQMIGKMRQGKFQVAGLAWGFDYPDAQNILQNLVGKEANEGLNSANFRNAEFDRLYEEASVMEDGPERTKLYERMAHIVGDQVPWITRTHRIRQNLQQPWLSGFRYTETTYQYWRYADVDVDMRQRLVAEWNRPVRWPLWVLGLLFAGFIGSTIATGRRGA